MAEFTFLNAEEFLNDSNELLSIKPNESVDVKFLIRDGGDIKGRWTHPLLINGKTRDVLCPAKDKKDADNGACPICKANAKRSISFFIPVYNFKTGSVQIWKRGANLLKNEEFRALLAENSRLCDEIIRITREEDETKDPYEATKYYFENITGTDYSDASCNLSDYDIPNIDTCGLLVYKSPEELRYYAKNGRFEDDIIPNSYNGVRRDYNNNQGGYYSSRRSSSDKEEEADSTYRSRRERYGNRDSGDNDDSGMGSRSGRPSSRRPF